ncbi:Uncharacterised protein [BD1-7 clade bacterium]|uniref:Uncharacterized protein n=1 Tax=BD1-7 clade bacterium TaxID=2029982 RepID=A0A5S9PE45_9GAMM|nr:Uncharacterised protein [BD1-7 clade bacterium]CAA0101927.1 Uncharacterised protein [BD1-7 clade bacterium]
MKHVFDTTKHEHTQKQKPTQSQRRSMPVGTRAWVVFSGILILVAMASGLVGCGGSPTQPQAAAAERAAPSAKPNTRQLVYAAKRLGNDPAISLVNDVMNIALLRSRSIFESDALLRQLYHNYVQLGGEGAYDKKQFDIRYVVMPTHHHSLNTRASTLTISAPALGGLTIMADFRGSTSKQVRNATTTVTTTVTTNTTVFSEVQYLSFTGSITIKTTLEGATTRVFVNSMADGLGHACDVVTARETSVGVGAITVVSAGGIPLPLPDAVGCVF